MEKVGEVAVDAGCIWIGDPCYVLPEDASHADWVRDWDNFCEAIDHSNPYTQFMFEHGAPGLGVVVPSGWGDGMYPVFVELNEDGRVAAVKVVFIDDDDEDDYDEPTEADEWHSFDPDC